MGRGRPTELLLRRHPHPRQDCATGPHRVSMSFLCNDIQATESCYAIPELPLRATLCFWNIFDILKRIVVIPDE
jgi:hypothetical protein